MKVKEENKISSLLKFCCAVIPALDICIFVLNSEIYKIKSRISHLCHTSPLLLLVIFLLGQNNNNTEL